MESAMGESSEKASKTNSTNSFFTRPAFLSLTIGVPFCLFKILFGIQFIRAAEIHSQPYFIYAGWVLMIWAGADLLMNLTRAGFDIIDSAGKIEFCTLAQIGRYLNASTLFLAIDTLITFSIICLALWSGWIVYLNKTEAMLWYSATTLNLISLSLVSLWTEIKRKLE
ncbi:hypothetical protein [Methanospirillum hungatei]|uniref:hypothetical protein n=1 Tax=Methanospirillum hungatei TaxID=2203 RepID=UPI0026F2EF8A|nr:hypothetical protein [Methanospirillum hungatei]MCA1917217.1 hypothetical protein [Methanospirillum hungatei]